MGRQYKKRKGGLKDKPKDKNVDFRVRYSVSIIRQSARRNQETVNGNRVVRHEKGTNMGKTQKASVPKLAIVKPGKPKKFFGSENCLNAQKSKSHIRQTTLFAPELPQPSAPSAFFAISSQSWTPANTAPPVPNNKPTLPARRPRVPSF